MEKTAIYFIIKCFKCGEHGEDCEEAEGMAELRAKYDGSACPESYCDGKCYVARDHNTDALHGNLSSNEDDYHYAGLVHVSDG